MLFSIIVPYYNDSMKIDTLLITLNDYINDVRCEIIIVDDYSDKKEYDILVSRIVILKAYNIVVVRNPSNVGPGVSRKNGFLKSKGSYIAFLDSDDGWVKNRIFKICNHMIDNNIDICGGKFRITTHEKFTSIRDDSSYKVESGKNINFINFLFNNYYATSSVVVRRECLKNNNFNEKFRFSEDFELWRRLAILVNSVQLTDSGSFCFKKIYISSGNNLSSQTNNMSKAEIYGIYILLFDSKVPLHLKPIIPFAMTFSLLKHFKRVIHITVSKL